MTTSLRSEDRLQSDLGKSLNQECWIKKYRLAKYVKKYRKNVNFLTKLKPNITYATKHIFIYCLFCRKVNE